MGEGRGHFHIWERGEVTSIYGRGERSPPYMGEGERSPPYMGEGRGHHIWERGRGHLHIWERGEVTSTYGRGERSPPCMNQPSFMDVGIQCTELIRCLDNRHVLCHLLVVTSLHMCICCTHIKCMNLSMFVQCCLTCTS